MNCHRCGKHMAYDKVYGYEETFWAWSCIFCGEVLDPVILKNRVNANARPMGSRRPKWSRDRGPEDEPA